MTTPYPYIEWEQDSMPHKSLWFSEAGLAPPSKVTLIDDTISANQALMLMKDGKGLLWVGDYQNGRELLRAIARRLDRPPRVGQDKSPDTPAEIFASHRQRQGVKAELMGLLLIALTKDFVIELRRGQEVALACKEVLGAISEPVVMPLKQLLAIVSAHEWRKKRVFIPALKEYITPHFGVFSPNRGEYLDLIGQAKLPKKYDIVFDIGVGTGVISILLAKRGIPKIVATDLDPRALACAQENVQSLGLQDQIELCLTDLFPQGHADLVVCNPPWLPAQPSSLIEHAIYDPDSRFLKAFLHQLPGHLNQDGQAWLILSDLAEHLGLRQHQDLLDWISQSGLVILNQLSTTAKHPKVQDKSDPLYFARSREVTSLWVLGIQ